MPKLRFHLRLFAMVALLTASVLVSGVMVGAQGRSVNAQSPTQDSVLQELAERLLGNAVSPSGAASVQLYSAALAPDFPSDVPLPPNSSLIGSDEHPSSPLPGIAALSPSPQSLTGIQVDVVLDASGSASNVVGFYRGALPADWSPASGSGVIPSGFVTVTTMAPPTVFCRSSDNASLTMTARPTTSGSLDVRLAFETGFNTCYPLPTPPTPGFGVVPVLQPPAGVPVYMNGGSGFGRARYGTDSVAVTDMSVGDLHGFFANELIGAGWTQTNTGGDALLTWSTWSIPDHSDLQGFLYVRDGAAAGQHSLHLEVDSTDPTAVTSAAGTGIDVGMPVFPPGYGVGATGPLAPVGPTPTPTTGP